MQRIGDDEFEAENLKSTGLGGANCMGFLLGVALQYGSMSEHDARTPILKTGDKYPAVALEIMKGIFVSIFVRAYLYEGYICMMNAEVHT